MRDVSLVSETEGLGIPLSKVGFPIRKFTDQSFLAAPRDLSQRSTSFIASQRQGIHQMPLFHLITLIINAHSTRRGYSNERIRIEHLVLVSLRKTSLFRDRSDIGVRLNNARMSVAPGSSPCATFWIDLSSRCQTATLYGSSRTVKRRRMNEPVAWLPSLRRQKSHRQDCRGIDTNLEGLVEPDGIEPTTSCLQSRRSPN